MPTRLPFLVPIYPFLLKDKFRTAILNFCAFCFKVLRQGVLITFICLFAFTQILAQDVLLGLTSKDGPGGGGTAFSIKTTGSDFKVHQSFLNMGENPTGDLIQATDGNFYGMTFSGGTKNGGTIFKMTADGSITVLRNLYGKDGSNPKGSLVQGKDGDLYGMTLYSAEATGNIFKISAIGTFTVLRQLNGNTDGGIPTGNLIQANDGSFYGMTSTGGINNSGTIFKITATGFFTVLRHLNSANDGSRPYGSLIQGKDGSLYGLTSSGGYYNEGTVFKISTTGSFNILRHLNNGSPGPLGSLVLGTDGYLYGMTYHVVFKISPTGIYKVVAIFDSALTGNYPKGSLIQGKDGNFYGMTFWGHPVGETVHGAIFKVTPAGVFTVLHKFKSITDGSNPSGSLVQGNDGNFYGMTWKGGNNHNRGFEGIGYGTIFKISISGSFKVLVCLPDGKKGLNPQESLMQGADGNYYGTTPTGGTYGYGTVFKLCTNGSFNTVSTFDKDSTGAELKGSLIQGRDGYFYGTSYQGGIPQTFSGGTIFKMNTKGKVTVLHRFKENDTSGWGPQGSLVQGSDGNFYGLTVGGGSKGAGTIFKITPAGSLTVLRHLAKSTDGGYPTGNLIQGQDGNFYGMANSGGAYAKGTIFKISANGTFSVLRHFNPASDGSPPSGSLLQGEDGNFYGMTPYGGTSNGGTIFKITVSGAYTILHHFNNAVEGGIPLGNLVQDSNGDFYGLTQFGGSFSVGTIFKFSKNGNYSVVRQLNPITDGGIPLGSLIIQKANPVAYAQSISTNVNTAKAIVLKGTGGSSLVYEIVTQPMNGTLSGSGAKRIYTPNTNFKGTDSLSFRIHWGCQNSTIKTVSIQVGTSVANIIRVNSGGGVLTTSLGNFNADTYFSGATIVSSTSSAIANTTNDALYQDNRRATTTGGSFSYNIPAANGLYTVKMHFAEVFFTAVGKRKFNVTAEGSNCLTNYDIYGAAGGVRTAIVVTKNINVTDGMLNLNFVSTVDKACVAAIEVLPTSGAQRLAMEVQPKVKSDIINSLYPNPVKSQITVQLSEPVDNPKTSVINAAGAEVLHNQHQVLASDKLMVDVELLRPGLYLLQVQSNLGYQTVKFLKE